VKHTRRRHALAQNAGAGYTGAVEYVLIAIPVALAGWRLAVFLSSRRNEPDRRVVRAARRGPFAPLGAVPEREDVVVRGRVVAGEAVLAAPLTGRSCVYYRAWVRKTGSEAREVTAEDRRSFRLEDGDTRVTVVFDKARVVAPEDFLGIDDDRAVDIVEEFALRQRHQFDALRSQLTAKESIIEVGQELRVAGRAVREPVADVAEAVVDLRDVRGETVITAELVFDPNEEPRYISLPASGD